MRSETKWPIWPPRLSSHLRFATTTIHASCPQSRHQNWTKINPQFPAHKNRVKPEDVSIRGLWTRGTDCIIDVRVTDTASNLSKTPPRSWKLTKGEKKKYLGLASSNVLSLHSWSPPIANRQEAKTLLKKLSPYWLISGKSYSDVWLCQCSYEYCHCPSHSPLSEAPVSLQANEQPSSLMGRQGDSVYSDSRDSIP
jgi:hypothetical protein